MTDELGKYREQRKQDVKLALAEFIKTIEEAFLDEVFQNETDLKQFIEKELFDKRNFASAPPAALAEPAFEKDFVAYFDKGNGDVEAEVYRVRFAYDPLLGDRYFIELKNLNQ